MSTPTATPYTWDERDEFIRDPHLFCEDEIVVPSDAGQPALQPSWFPLVTEAIRLLVSEHDWRIKVSATGQPTDAPLTPDAVAEIVRRSPRLAASLVVDGNTVRDPETGSELVVEG